MPQKNAHMSTFRPFPLAAVASALPHGDADLPLSAIRTAAREGRQQEEFYQAASSAHTLEWVVSGALTEDGILSAV